MKKKLKIAVVANTNISIPPYFGYGGTQRGIYDFITEFNKKGHSITLFAPLSSDVSNLENITLEGISKPGIWEPGNTLSIEEKEKITKKYSNFVVNKLKEGNFDIINIRMDHPDVFDKLIEVGFKDKIVYSLHNTRSTEKLEPILEHKIQCVAHCKNHKEEYGNLDNIKAITYGINTGDYPFSSKTLTQISKTPIFDIQKKLKEENKDYLIHLSCIGAHKGQKTSIEISKETGIPLILVGEPQKRKSTEYVDYFYEHINPEVDGELIYYFGNANEEQKKELLKYSKGFLFPSGYEDRRWKEPFGRAPVEALSCGTPIVAFNRGSLPELIEHGHNGYLFDAKNEAIEYVKELDNIERENCRTYAVTNFDKVRVANQYESLFKEIVEKNKNQSHNLSTSTQAVEF